MILWNTDLMQMPEPADGEDFGPMVLVALLDETGDRQGIMFARLAWFAEGKDGTRALALQCCVTGARIEHLTPFAWAPEAEFLPPDPAAF